VTDDLIKNLVYRIGFIVEQSICPISWKNVKKCSFAHITAKLRFYFSIAALLVKIAWK